MFRNNGCLSCHTLGGSHSISCEGCHGGRPSQSAKGAAHAGLIPNPSSPENMIKVCGTCHAQEVRRATQSFHFTLNSEIQKTWQAFFPDEAMDLDKLQGIATLPWNPMTHRRLVADLLVRRCLRCHPYTSGDGYAMTHRKTGCAACHNLHETTAKKSNAKNLNILGAAHGHLFRAANNLPPGGGLADGGLPADGGRQLLSLGPPHSINTHAPPPAEPRVWQGIQDTLDMKKVADERCLSCHYANFVGWDYYGRFEKDYEEDYRAPLEQGRISLRPYGVEWHEMTPDVHSKAGMSCTDCHVLGPCQEEQGQKMRLECVDCHTAEAEAVSQIDQPGNNTMQQKLVKFKGPVMQPNRVGHRPEDWNRVSCAACHAIWSVQDVGRSLTLQEDPLWEEWSYLMVQGSSEVERIVGYHLIRQGFWQPFEPGMEIADSMAVSKDRNGCAQGASLPPCMRNKFTGECGSGVWFEAFLQRRWAPVPLGVDKNGRVSVMRPILDLELFYVNKEDQTVINGLKPVSGQMQPYTPHTIGKADRFRSREVERILNSQ